MSESAAYELRVHPRAKAELDDFNPDLTDELKDILEQASQTRQPSSLACIQHLQNGDGLLRVKRGNVRVICEFRTPVIGVLLAGKRRTVYQNLDVATERAAEVFADD